MSEWIPIKTLPENEDQLCCFVQFHAGIAITSYVEIWAAIKAHRNYEIKNTFTHWCPLSKAPKKSKT